MGIGSASGEGRAVKAIEAALTSPLLSANDITGAQSILLNIKSGTGKNEITMDELGELTDYVYEAVSDGGPDNQGIVNRGGVWARRSV